VNSQIIFAGFTYRKCLGDNQWESINLSVCQTVEIMRLFERAEELSTLFQRVTSVIDRDITRTFRLKDGLEIVDQILNVINVTQPVLPNDLPTISDIIRDIIL